MFVRISINLTIVNKNLVTSVAKTITFGADVFWSGTNILINVKSLGCIRIAEN